MSVPKHTCRDVVVFDGGDEVVKCEEALYFGTMCIVGCL